MPGCVSALSDSACLCLIVGGCDQAVFVCAMNDGVCLGLWPHASVGQCEHCVLKCGSVDFVSCPRVIVWLGCSHPQMLAPVGAPPTAASLLH